jgi:hypothetical protein
MSAILVRNARRRTVRRAVTTPCWAVSLGDCRPLGDNILDLSIRGALLACDDRVEPGENVFLSFKAPGSGNLWLNAEAEIARVVNGWRPTDAGYCAGLRMIYLESGARGELGRRLRGLPPPVPARRIRPDYAETVRRIACG